MKVHIFTDGAAKGNPGPGGFGIVLRSERGHHKEVARGYRLTTNNRMELLAVIVALEMLKGSQDDVTVFSDSRYVVDSVEQGWLWNWQRKGFEKIKNADLWRRFIPAYKRHKVKFQWIKGHSGHKENERCDQMAVAAADLPVLLVDEEYEKLKDTGMFEE
ncbi:MAG: ribonuclease HI [Flavobacteriales bacterium]